MLLSRTLTATEQSTLKEAVIATADKKAVLRKMVAQNRKFAEWVNEHKVSEFALELFGESYLERNPLYIDRKKTALCDALYYIKKLAKQVIDPTIKKAVDPDEVEPTAKSLAEMVNDINYIADHWSEFDDGTKNALTLAIKRLKSLK